MGDFFSLEPPIFFVETNTIKINKYSYQLSNIIPHKSVIYSICCYDDNNQVKYISKILEGEQYKEWTTDEWMDAFIKSKVEALNISI